MNLLSHSVKGVIGILAFYSIIIFFLYRILTMCKRGNRDEEGDN